MQVIRLNQTSVLNHFTTMPRCESLQSDAEWIALDCLVQMLEGHFGHSIDRSECVPRQDDPPDCRLTIEGIEYGVEVTIFSDGDNQQYAWFDEFITELRIQVDKKNIAFFGSKKHTDFYLNCGLNNGVRFKGSP